MVVVKLDDLDIDFPYEPYKTQENYMRHVVRCVSLGHNAVLESPTGTGKTLNLLCSTLAWQQAEKARRLASIKEGAQSSAEVEAAIGIVPRIIYTSRTHSQLTHVLHELGKTVYGGVKIAILGSRDQLCLHPEVVSQKNSNVRNVMCRAKIKSRTCDFYNNYEKMADLDNRLNQMKMQDKDQKIMDIEDLTKFGQRHRICPYFRARHGFDSADLILMPYNYVLDPGVRRANKVDLKGCVIIFDEAHNLQAVCEESASVKFTTVDLAAAIRDAGQALDAASLEMESHRLEMDGTDLGFGEVAKTDLPEIPFEVEDLSRVKVILLRLEEKLNECIASPPDKDKHIRVGSELPGIVMSGSFMYHLFDSAEFQPGYATSISQLASGVATYLTGKQGLLGELPGATMWAGNASHGDSLLRLSSLLESLFPKETTSVSCVDAYAEHAQYFYTYMHEEVPKEEKKSATAIWAFEQFCLSAAPTMHDLLAKSPRSIIVTSGTLSPLQAFASSLAIPFEVVSSCDHVITSLQVWAGVVGVGPSPQNQLLQGSFINRGNENYLRAVGQSVIQIVQMVPQGVLIFFASYYFMQALIDSWKQSDIWTKLSQIKPCFIEPRDKRLLEPIRLQFVENASSLRGAVFCCVCRGKLSEGIDFADSQARAVILISIPYPPVRDPRVVLKRKYIADERRRAGPVVPRGCDDIADDWYQLEAVRAVNQAIGRAIRHRNDFGAMILLDCRYGRMGSGLPGWVQKQFKEFPSKGSKIQGRIPGQPFNEAMASLAGFFRKHKAALAKQNWQLKQRGSESAFTSVRSTSSVTTSGNADGTPINADTDLMHAYATEAVKETVNKDEEEVKQSEAKISVLDTIEAEVDKTMKNSEENSAGLSARRKTQPMSYLNITNDNVDDVEIKQPAKKRFKLRPNDRPPPTPLPVPKESSKSMNFVQLMKTKADTKLKKEVTRTLAIYQKSKEFSDLVPVKDLLLPNHVDLFRSLIEIVFAKHRDQFASFCTDCLE